MIDADEIKQIERMMKKERNGGHSCKMECIKAFSETTETASIALMLGPQKKTLISSEL